MRQIGGFEPIPTMLTGLADVDMFRSGVWSLFLWE
jgi:hypothetical protein